MGEQISSADFEQFSVGVYNVSKITMKMAVIS